MFRWGHSWRSRFVQPGFLVASWSLLEPLVPVRIVLCRDVQSTEVDGVDAGVQFSDFRWSFSGPLQLSVAQWSATPTSNPHHLLLRTSDRPGHHPTVPVPVSVPHSSTFSSSPSPAAHHRRPQSTEHNEQPLNGSWNRASQPSKRREREEPPHLTCNMHTTTLTNS